MGRGRPGQNPSFVATLLPGHQWAAWTDISLVNRWVYLGWWFWFWLVIDYCNIIGIIALYWFYVHDLTIFITVLSCFVIYCLLQLGMFFGIHNSTQAHLRGWQQWPWSHRRCPWRTDQDVERGWDAWCRVAGLCNLDDLIITGFVSDWEVYEVSGAIQWIWSQNYHELLV